MNEKKKTYEKQSTKVQKIIIYKNRSMTEHIFRIKISTVRSPIEMWWCGVTNSNFIKYLYHVWLAWNATMSILFLVEIYDINRMHGKMKIRKTKANSCQLMHDFCKTNEVRHVSNSFYTFCFVEYCVYVKYTPTSSILDGNWSVLSKPKKKKKNFIVCMQLSAVNEKKIHISNSMYASNNVFYLIFLFRNA